MTLRVTQNSRVAVAEAPGLQGASSNPDIRDATVGGQFVLHGVPFQTVPSQTEEPGLVAPRAARLLGIYNPRVSDGATELQMMRHHYDNLDPRTDQAVLTPHETVMKIGAGNVRLVRNPVEIAQIMS